MNFYVMSTWCKMKLSQITHRSINDQSGVDGLIVTLILVGVALILGFAFKSTLKIMVENLWNSLVKDGNIDTTRDSVGGDWNW